MNLEGCIVYQKYYKETVGIVVLDKLKDCEAMILIKLNKNVDYGWSISNGAMEQELIKQLNKKNVKFEFNKTKFWWLDVSGFTTNKEIFMKDEFNFYVKKENGLLKNE